MIDFFLLSLPIFAVMGVGWAATRTRLVAQGALDALSAFSFQFALPALVLRLIAGQRQSVTWVPRAAVLCYPETPPVPTKCRASALASFRRYSTVASFRYSTVASSDCRE